jgi:hypothetical protein
MLSCTGLQAEAGVADRIDLAGCELVPARRSIELQPGFAVTSLCTPPPLLGFMARAHAHSSTVV